MADRDETNAIVNYLLSTGVVAYQRGLARAVGDHSAGLLLSQFWYWSEKLPDERGGWFFMTQEQITEETVMTRREQETARRKLRDIGVLEEKKQGVPAKLWFRINKEAVVDLMKSQAGLQDGGKRHPSMAESAMLVSPKAPGKNGGFSHTISKNSPKISSKNTTAAEQAESIEPVHAETAAAVLIEELVTFELNRKDASQFANTRPEVCRNQLDYLKYILAHSPDFKFKSSQGAYLRDAIEQEYAPPPGYKEEQKRRQQAEARKQADATQKAREVHRAQFLHQYMDYLRLMQDRLAKSHLEAYRRFQEKEESQIKKYQQLNLRIPLQQFQREEDRLIRIQEHFHEYAPCKVLGFWEWDQEFNSETSQGENQKIAIAK